MSVNKKGRSYPSFCPDPLESLKKLLEGGCGSTIRFIKTDNIYRTASPVGTGSTILPVSIGSSNALFKPKACLLVPGPLPCKMSYDLLMLIKSKSVEPGLRRCAL